MNTALKLSTVTVAATLVSLPIAGSAHHSMTEFTRDVVVEIEGVMSRVSWRNPHILYELTSTDDTGAETIWHLEGSAVSAQRRRGLTGDEVSVGDAVRVAGWASTRRDNYIQVSHILMPNGVELLVGGAREPRWAEESLGGNQDVLAESRAPDTMADGIFRVWSQGTGAWFFSGRSGYQLNEAAAAAVAERDDIADNPIIKCVPPGMPALMGNPYPMQFVQVDDNIELRFEEFDALRIIHMGDDVADPEDVPLSHWGHSIGHWEGETLVVDTSRIGWQYFNRSGAPQTPNVRINERFTVVDGGNRLDYVMTVDEPATLVEPFVWDAYFVWKPGEQIGSYECLLEEWGSPENTLTN